MLKKTRNLHVGCLPFLQCASKLTINCFVQLNWLSGLLQYGAIMMPSVVLGFGRNPAYICADKQKYLRQNVCVHLQPESKITVQFWGGKKALYLKFVLLCGAVSYEVSSQVSTPELCEQVMPLQLQWGVLWMLAVGVGGDSCAFGVHRGEGLGTLWNTELQKSFKESFREQRGNMGV